MLLHACFYVMHIKRLVITHEWSLFSLVGRLNIEVGAALYLLMTGQQALIWNALLRKNN